MKRETIKTNYFYGNKCSDYAIKNGYVDYKTLSKAFDAVLCNDITKLFYNTIGGEYNEVEQMNGFIDNGDTIDELQEEQDNPGEIFQYFIISDNGAQILQEWTDEIVYYIPVLNVYVWGVTHYGVSWDYVLTNIKIKPEKIDE